MKTFRTALAFAAATLASTAALAAPNLNFSTTPVAFYAVVGSSNPISRTIQLTNTGDVPFNYYAFENSLWIFSGMPLSGSVPTGGVPYDFTITVDPSSRAAGTWQDSIVFSMVGFPARTLPVFLIMYNPPARMKGDLNGDGVLSGADVVLELNCIFLGQGDCLPAAADANCDGGLSPQDIVLELQGVFLGQNFPC